MTLETYEQATALLDELASIKRYIGQFQSAIDNAIMEEETEELKESRQTLEEAIANLHMELAEKEAAFAQL